MLVLISGVQIFLDEALLEFNLSPASHWTAPKLPLEFNLYATEEYKKMIPEPHDWLHVDPMRLLHTKDEQEREEQLMRIFDYLGFDYSIVDVGMLLCEKYMQDNKKLYKDRGFAK